MSKNTTEELREQIDAIIRDLNVAIFEAIGDKLAPKQENGSPERKLLLSAISDTLGAEAEAKTQIKQLISNREKLLLDRVEKEITDKVTTTTIQNIHPLKNGHYVRTDNLIKMLATLRKELDGEERLAALQG